MMAGGVSAEDWQSVVPAAPRAGLLAATALIALVAASAAATAAPEGGGNAAARTAAVPSPQAFAIPPQPLKAALTAFAQQSGLQVSLDSAATVGLRSPGV